MIWAFMSIIILTLWTGCSNHEEQAVDEQAVVMDSEYSSLIQNSCFTCHAVEDGHVDRISDVRKTPEGWDLTISRMQNVWGLNVTDEEKREIIKELSVKNGLAPEEMESVMYWITREGTVFEDDQDGLFAQSCMRCHSIGQPLAQRRTAEEWEKLKDFHVAFNPSLIYQLRDIDWEEEAGKVISYLQENYQFNTAEYEKWMENQVTHNPVGEWRIVGVSPGEGMYTGYSTFKDQGNDFFEERTITIDGEEIKHSGNSILYGGYSLRTSMDGDVRYRGIYNFDQDGKKISGSRVKVGNTGIYANEVYYAVGETELLAAWPRSVQKGVKTKVHIAGNGLPENISLEQVQTDGSLNVLTIEQEKDDLWIEVEIPSDVQLDNVIESEISIDGVKNSVTLNLFSEVDYVKVTPEYGLSRFGNEYERTSVQFQAIAYSNGPDGQAETEDDIELGPVQATWSMTHHNPYGIENDNDKYIGTLDKDTGLFVPAGPGPNPEREWSTNNSGGVNVHAVYVDPVTGKQFTAEGFLISTVPDYVPQVH